jgi:hypothetical protein
VPIPSISRREPLPVSLYCVYIDGPVPSKSSISLKGFDWFIYDVVEDPPPSKSSMAEVPPS